MTILKNSNKMEDAMVASFSMWWCIPVPNLVHLKNVRWQIAQEEATWSRRAWPTSQYDVNFERGLAWWIYFLKAIIFHGYYLTQIIKMWRSHIFSEWFWITYDFWKNRYSGPHMKLNGPRKKCYTFPRKWKVEYPHDCTTTRVHTHVSTPGYRGSEVI